MTLNRRGLLKRATVGVTASATLPLLPTAGSAAPVHDHASTESTECRQRALHQQVPYFDYSGGGEVYVAPTGTTRTADYAASLTDEEFLRRHWFR
mgnify:FL=1|jgi:hypothetical protein